MQIERKGDNVVITVPCGASTLAQGHLSSTGKNWVFGAGKLQAGDLTFQVSAYTKNAPVAKADAA
jgi:hypothetical protein